AWKRYLTILVSDAGGKMGPQARPKTDWLRHSFRMFELVDNQVRSLRKRQVINAYEVKPVGGPGWRDGAYWGIRTDILNYRLADPLLCPHHLTMRLAEVPTRLAALDTTTQERLINWGYAVCDAAMRKHVVPTAARPSDFPYPASGVG
ncbi:MAG: patatin-like phospholipase family protein, partial [Armatimonadota bacterium]